MVSLAWFQSSGVGSGQCSCARFSHASRSGLNPLCAHWLGLAWLKADLHLGSIFYKTRTVFSLVVFSALLCISFSAALQRYLGVKTVVITAATVCLSCSHCS